MGGERGERKGKPGSREVRKCSGAGGNSWSGTCRKGIRGTKWNIKT